MVNDWYCVDFRYIYIEPLLTYGWWTKFGKPIGPNSTGPGFQPSTAWKNCLGMEISMNSSMNSCHVKSDEMVNTWWTGLLICHDKQIPGMFDQMVNWCNMNCIYELVPPLALWWRFNSHLVRFQMQKGKKTGNYDELAPQIALSNNAWLLPFENGGKHMIIWFVPSLEGKQQMWWRNRWKFGWSWNSFGSSIHHVPNCQVVEPLPALQPPRLIMCQVL